MNNKGMFYTNVDDYETKVDMMNDFIALRMYDMAKDKELEKLNNIINELDKLIEQYSKNDYYYKYNGKYLKSEIINDLKTIRGVDKE